MENSNWAGRLMAPKTLADNSKQKGPFPCAGSKVT